MPQMGRPKLISKEGHHHHDGYGRWHPVEQPHGIRTEVLHKEFSSKSPREDTQKKDSAAYEIFELVEELEKMQTGRILITELQKSIETLIERNKRKKKPRIDPSRKVEQESIGKESSEEEREPNTYGLP